MRVALLLEGDMCRPSDRRHAFVAALQREIVGMELFPTHDDHARVLDRVAARRREFDLVMTFVYFRKLRHLADALRAIALPVVVLEYDAYQNHVSASTRRGQLSAFLARARVDLLVATGWRHCERLRDEGVQVLYLPKAAPADFLRRANDYRGTFCAFGSVRDPVYAKRAALFDMFDPVDAPDLGKPRLTRSQRLQDRPAVDRLRFDFARMAAVLPRYSGCVICDLGLDEPMAKHFEVAALGLAPIRDEEAEAELNALGYRDGVSMVVYRDPADLFDKLRYYQRHASALRRLQDNARIASCHHTWEARARSLRQALGSQS